jgi:hypothetical protein
VATFRMWFTPTGGHVSAATGPRREGQSERECRVGDEGALFVASRFRLVFRRYLGLGSDCCRAPSRRESGSSAARPSRLSVQAIRGVPRAAQ